MSAILSSGVASARKSSTPASSAIAAAVSGLSPVIITVRMPIARSWSKRSRMPGFTVSLRWMTPSTGASPASTLRRRPRAACRRASETCVDDAVQLVRSCSALAPTQRAIIGRRPCAPGARRRRGRCPLMRVWAVNGTASPAPSAPVGAASRSRPGGELDDRAPLRRLVGQRATSQRGLRAAPPTSTPRSGEELGRLTVARR